MVIGSGLLVTWHLEELPVPRLFYLFTLWIMHELVWLMMLRLLRRVVRDSLVGWSMFTRRRLNLMALLVFTEDSTYHVLA